MSDACGPGCTLYQQVMSVTIDLDRTATGASTASDMQASVLVECPCCRRTHAAPLAQAGASGAWG